MPPARHKELTRENLKLHMNDQLWRLNNLYYCLDKKTALVIPFIMNSAQRKFFENSHWRNIIVKARQRGFTTLICILGLDFALFNPNRNVGFLAHKNDESKKIYQNKILFPYDQLDPLIKDMRPTVQRQTTGGLVSFSNGSSIQVGMSLMGQTCHFLHVSEFGTICAEYPARADRIVGDTLPTVPETGRVFIESTTKGAFGRFYEMAKAAYLKMVRRQHLTYLDFKLHFVPWWTDKGYSLPPSDSKFIRLNNKQEKYFRKLAAEGKKHKVNINLSKGQKAWYVKQQETQGPQMFQQYPGTFQEAFRVVIDGAYYEAQLEKAYMDGRIGDFPPVKGVAVTSCWDLGYHDQQAIWGYQKVGGMYRMIYYYQASGEGLEHYINELKKTKFKWARHLAPHDVEQHDWTSGKSKIELAAKAGIQFQTAPRLSLEDGIEATRRFLAHCVFHESACDHGLRALAAYQKEWNPERADYKKNPRENWAIHGADSLRTAAVMEDPKMLKEREAGVGVQGATAREETPTEHDLLDNAFV